MSSHLLSAILLAGTVSYEGQVQPIFETKCFSCHGPEKQLAGLRLDRRQAALRGGDYGKVIIPGDSANSKLIHRVSGSTAGMQMPPAGPLEPHEISILRAWIDQGPTYGNSQQEAPPARPRDTSPVLTGLIDAIVAGNRAAIAAVLANHPGVVNEADGGGSTALMHAASRGNVAAVELLLAAKVPVDPKNRRGATALVWALGDPAKVRLILDAGADPRIKTIDGRTPLHIAAAQAALPEVARMLIEKGADVNALDVAGQTPLHLAAGAGGAEIVAMLLAKGAKVNAAAANGATPLIGAAMAGASPAVRLLLAKGADPKAVTKRNVSALGPASYWGDVEVMKLLIAGGAPVNLHEADGYSPLMYAAYSEVAPPEAAHLLLENGAKAQAGGEGETPVSLAKMRGATNVVQLLERSSPSRIQRAVTKALEPLIAQSPNFVRIGGCNSCHNQDLPVFAQSIARSRGIPAGGEIALLPGVDAYERVFEHSGLLGASSLGYAAMMHAARKEPLSAQTDAAANYLMAHQESDGRWAARSNRQPLSTGDHHATAFAIFVLRTYGQPARQAEIDARTARAVAWLEEHRPVSNQDASMQLLGLVWGRADKTAIERSVTAVRARQREDGGWSQLESLASDAYATGQALYSLALAGVTAYDAAYRRGVAYLLATQAADGTWHVKARSKPFQPYFESGFPYGHDQWISAAGTSWAAMALSMSVPVPAQTAQTR